MEIPREVIWEGVGRALMGLMAVTSAWLVVYFAQQLGRRRFFASGAGVSVMGHIVKLRSGGYGQAMKVQFTDADGRTHSFWTDFFNAPGDVEVLYDPGRPDRAEAKWNVASGWLRLRVGIAVFAAMAVGFAGMALFLR